MYGILYAHRVLVQYSNSTDGLTYVSDISGNRSFSKSKPTNHTNFCASFSASTLATVPDLLLFAYLGLWWMQGVVHKYKSSTGDTESNFNRELLE